MKRCLKFSKYFLYYVYCNEINQSNGGGNEIELNFATKLQNLYQGNQSGKKGEMKKMKVENKKMKKIDEADIEI